METRQAWAAIGLALAAGSATAATAEFNGYFRAGGGSSSKGGKEVCYRLPGAAVWFRLGNECDTYADLVFGSTLGEVDGTSFRAQFRFSYGTQGVANWEQTTPSWREVFVEARDIGAGLGVPALRGASLWAGKRFYGNRDIHMLDYGFWEPNQGFGVGIDGVDVGVGKLSYALVRMGDNKGYDTPKSLGGFQPDLIGGGSRTVTVHDLRLEGIESNPGGKVSVGVDLALKNNRDGTSSYATQRTRVVYVDDDNDPQTPNVPITVVEQVTNTFDNEPGRNGLGLHVQHTQDDFLGLGGFHQLGLKFAKDAMTLRGVGIAGSREKRTEWLLFDHWVLEPRGSRFTASATAGFRHARVFDAALGRDVTGKEFWVGARPQYHLNNIWSLMAEVGYQQAQSDGDDFGTRKLAKATVGTQFSMGRSIWSRPAIRFYGTWAKWNDAAARAEAAGKGSVTCTGRDCGTPVDSFRDQRSGFSYGVQIEGWF